MNLLADPAFLLPVEPLRVSPSCVFPREHPYIRVCACVTHLSFQHMDPREPNSGLLASSFTY